MPTCSRCRRRFKRWLQKRKVFLWAVLVLLLAGVGFRASIKVLERRAERLALLQEQMQLARDKDDSVRVFGLTRELEYARLEPVFYGLFIAIPVTLVGIGIIFSYFIKSPEPWTSNVPDNDWIDVARHKRASRYTDDG